MSRCDFLAPDVPKVAPLQSEQSAVDSNQSGIGRPDAEQGHDILGAWRDPLNDLTRLARQHEQSERGNERDHQRENDAQIFVDPAVDLGLLHRGGAPIHHQTGFRPCVHNYPIHVPFVNYCSFNISSFLFSILFS